MSVLTSAVRLSHAAGQDSAGRLGQQPGGFSAAFSARCFSFLFYFLRLRVHALVLPLASPLSFSSPFLLSFSFFVSFRSTLRLQDSSVGVCLFIVRIWFVQ